MRKIGWKIEVTSKLVKAFGGKLKTKILLKMLFVTFKINCATVYFTYNKLYSFEVYSPLNFDQYVYLYIAQFKPRLVFITEKVPLFPTAVIPTLHLHPKQPVVCF